MNDRLEQDRDSSTDTKLHCEGNDIQNTKDKLAGSFGITAEELKISVLIGMTLVTGDEHSHRRVYILG